VAVSWCAMAAAGAPPLPSAGRVRPNGCRVLKASDVHPQLFKGANRKFKKIPWSK